MARTEPVSAVMVAVRVENMEGVGVVDTRPVVGTPI